MPCFVREERGKAQGVRDIRSPQQLFISIPSGIRLRRFPPLRYAFGPSLAEVNHVVRDTTRFARASEHGNNTRTILASPIIFNALKYIRRFFTQNNMCCYNSITILLLHHVMTLQFYDIKIMKLDFLYRIMIHTMYIAIINYNISIILISIYSSFIVYF